MTGRERLLAAIRHEEADRVPISPRISIWMQAELGSSSLATMLNELPAVDPMHIVGDGAVNYLDSYPETYDLPGVAVGEKRYCEEGLEVVERSFQTPAGTLRDRTKIAPAGGEYGMAPNPIKTEHVVKGPDDLPALQYLLKPVNTNFDFLQTDRDLLGHRGVLMVCIRSALDHNAGYARDMQDLMMDYYDDRAFFDDLVGLYHRRSLEQIRAACEAGVEFIFGSWYFTSLSAGWSPAIFGEVFAPMIREHVELTHSYGAYYDFYDDGILDASMDMIAAAGVDVLETCTPPPVGDFDLARAVERIGGKTAIKGYIDLLYVVKHGTPDLVRETVREAMATAKQGGGFIIGSSDSFREGTPRENVDAYFAACLEYGQY